MKVRILVLGLSLIITGCEQATENAIVQLYPNGNLQTPVIALSPGWQIDDHGKMGMVYGNGECPTSFLHSNVESGCVIINTMDKAVSVLIGYGETPHKTIKEERWTIERQGVSSNDLMRLKRPDNSYVIPWHKNATSA